MSLDALGRGMISSPVSGGQSALGQAGLVKSAGSQNMPFEDLVRGLIQDTNSQQTAVRDSVQQLVSGETDSIHDVVLTASRADLAFRLVMEIRNRLISSYQEIMRMQV